MAGCKSSLTGEDFYGPAKVKATQARNAAERDRASLVASRDGLFGQIVLLRQTLAQAREDLVNESAREAAQAEAVQAAIKEVESDIERVRGELRETGDLLESLHRALPIDLTSRDIDASIVAASNEIRAVELRLAGELVAPDTVCSACGQAVSATSHKKQRAARDADTRRLVALRQSLASHRKQVVELRALEMRIVEVKQRDTGLKGKMSTLQDLHQRALEKRPTVESRVPVLEERVATLDATMRSRFTEYAAKKREVLEIGRAHV